MFLSLEVDQQTIYNIRLKSRFYFQSLNYQAHAQSAQALRACALRALGLLLADGTPTVGGGKTF